MPDEVTDGLQGEVSIDEALHRGIAALRALVAAAGPEQVLLGSDYPFDMGADHPMDEVVEARLAGEDAARAPAGNAAALDMTPADVPAARTSKILRSRLHAGTTTAVGVMPFLTAPRRCWAAGVVHVR